MNCPKCNAVMEKLKFQAIEVDRCSSCKGIWFDLLENEDLKGLEDSESIDVGDVEIGKQQNAKGKINCPVCQTQMIRLVDVDQPHISYEGCTICSGVFFDAGEFKDFKEKTVGEFFKDLLSKERK